MSLTYDIEDEKKQLSVDCVELNEIVLRLRPVIRKAKVHVLRELAIYIKRLKRKQTVAPASKIPRIGKKILGRLSEIRLLKKMGTIRLCKLVMSNLMAYKDLEKCGQSLSKQDRLVVRLAACPEVTAFVNKFRADHTDWPALVHFLLYKNTSGKWKTSEQKRQASKKRKGDLPFPIAEVPELLTGNNENDENLLTIKKFTAFKEAHDRQLLDSQRRMLADEAERAGLTCPSAPLFIPPLLGSDAEEEEEEDDDDDDDDDDSDALERAVDKAAGVALERRQAIEVDSELPIVSTNCPPSSEDIRFNAQKLEVPIKAQSQKIEENDSAVANSEGAKLAVKELPKDSFFSEVIDISESRLVVGLVAEDEEIFGEDDVEIKKEMRGKKYTGGEGRLAKNRTKRVRGYGQPDPRRHQSQNRRQINATYLRPLQVKASRDGRKPQMPVKFDTTGLHPSWIAKRQQKQAAILNPDQAAATNKRIVFS